MEHRHDGRAVVQHHLSVGIRHRLPHLGLVLVKFFAPFGPGVLLRQPRRAAAGIGAHVRVGVVRLGRGAHAVVEIRAFRRRLRFQGLRFKDGGHLAPHDAGQVLRRRQRPHRAAVPQPQRMGGIGACAALLRGLFRLQRPGRGIVFRRRVLRPQPRRKKQQQQQQQSRRNDLSHGHTSFPPYSVEAMTGENRGKVSCNNLPERI